MKILKIILGILFLLFAYFQLNDPDPLIWVSIYVLIGIMSLASAFNISSRYAILGAMVICLVGGLVSFPGVWDYVTNQDGKTIMEGMSNDKPYIEQTREFGGLLIGLLALTFLYIQDRKKTVSTRTAT